MSEQDNGLSKENFYERLLEYISRNPFFALWNLAVIIGGLVGYFHYSRIGYVPEIDFKSAATILIALALTGTVLAIIVALIFLVPALYLRMILWDESPQTDQVNLETPSDPKDRALIAKRKSVGAVILRTAILAKGLWSLLIWIEQGAPYQFPLAWFGLIGTVLIIASTIAANKLAFLFRLCMKRQKTEGTSESQRWYLKHLNFIMATIVWAFAFGLIASMVDSPILNNKELSNGDKAFWLITFLGIVVFSNAILAIPGLAKKKRYAPLLILLFAAMPAAYFMVLPGNAFSVEKATFNTLGLGSLENSFFLVKAEACDAINVVRENTCVHVGQSNEVEDSIKISAKSIGCIRPAFLENRLGPEFLLAFEEKMPEGKASSSKKNEILIPLKKDDVLLWAFGQTTNVGNSQCPKLDAVMPKTNSRLAPKNLSGSGAENELHYLFTALFAGKHTLRFGMQGFRLARNGNSSVRENLISPNEILNKLA